MTLGNGSAVSAWDAHYACFKGKTELCTASAFPDVVYEDNWVGRNAIAILDKWKQGNRDRSLDAKPFFLQVNFPGPHPPFLVTAAMADNVTDRAWPQPADEKARDLCTNVKGAPGGVATTTERCNYASEIENLDQQFQTIVDHIESLGELENTIVCLSSDHGDLLGDHGEEVGVRGARGGGGVKRGGGDEEGKGG